MGQSAWTLPHRYAPPFVAPALDDMCTHCSELQCVQTVCRLQLHPGWYCRYWHRSVHMQVLNYGQAIFEGMKAQRTDKGQIVLFRPSDNAARMREGARRMSMVPPDEALFLKGVVGAVRENMDMVPPAGKGSLYLRPLLLGTGPILGLGTAPGFTFTVYGTPVGSYFKARSRTCALVACSCVAFLASILRHRSRTSLLL